MRLGLPGEVSALTAIWRNEELCDVLLTSRDGDSVKAHSVILAAASPFFRALFIGAGSEMMERGRRLPTGERDVVLNGVSTEGLLLMLNAVYTDTIEITRENLQTVLETSNQLEIGPIRDACCKYLRSNLALENCLLILELAETYHFFQLRDDTLAFVCHRFEELMSVADWRSHVARLSKEHLLQIIQNQDITVDSEKQILKFGLAWIQEETDRKLDALAILCRVRLPPMIIRDEIQRLGMDPEELMPSDDALSRRPCYMETSSRSPTQILIAGGHDAAWRTFKAVEIYHPDQDSWTNGLSMPCSFSLAAAGSMHRRVIVIGGSMIENVCEYDARRQLWKRGPSLSAPRIHSAAASLGYAVVVCGGRTGFTGSLNSTEMLRFDDDSWSEGIAMCEARCAFGLAALNGCLYAVGGQSGRGTHDTVEVFHLGAERWTILEDSQMHTGRKYLAVGAAGGRIYAIGGMNEQRVRLSSVEALDPREGKWKQLCEMVVQRSSCGAASVDDRLFVMGGNAGDDRMHDSVECYDETADAWRMCAAMPCGRSGLAAVAL